MCSLWLVLKSVLGCFIHFGYITKFIKRKILISEEGILKPKKKTPHWNSQGFSRRRGGGGGGGGTNNETTVNSDQNELDKATITQFQLVAFTITETLRLTAICLQTFGY
jgi:hypothetical protein